MQDDKFDWAAYIAENETQIEKDLVARANKERRKLNTPLIPTNEDGTIKSKD